MNLLDNPFYVLGVDPETSREKLVRLVDDLALQDPDPALLAGARSLLHPKQRLSAEVHWLPGVPSSRARELAERLKVSPGPILPERDGLHGLAGHNVVVTAIEQGGNGHSLTDLARGLAFLSLFQFEFDAHDIRQSINDARRVAGFPPVREIDVIDQELARVRTEGALAIRRILENLSVEQLATVLASAVESFWHRCKDPAAGTLIFSAITDYENRASEEIQERAEKFVGLLSLGAVLPLVFGMETRWIGDLEQALTSWLELTRPMVANSAIHGFSWEPLEDLEGVINEAAIVTHMMTGRLELAVNLRTSLVNIIVRERSRYSRLRQPAAVP